MSLPKFRQLNLSDERIMRFQDNVAAGLDPLLASPLTSAIVVTNVRLVSGSNQVQHDLGQVPLGGIVCSQDAPANVFVDVVGSLTPLITVKVLSDAGVTVSMLVF